MDEVTSTSEKIVEFENFLISLKDNSLLKDDLLQNKIHEFCLFFFEQKKYELCLQAIKINSNKNFLIYHIWFKTCLALGRLNQIQTIVDQANNYFLKNRLLQCLLNFNDQISKYYKPYQSLEKSILELSLIFHSNELIKEYFDKILERAKINDDKESLHFLINLNILFKPNSIETKIISTKIKLINNGARTQSRIKLIYTILLLSKNIIEDAVDLIFLNKNNTPIASELFNYLQDVEDFDYENYAKKYKFLLGINPKRKLKLSYPFDENEQSIKNILSNKYVNFSNKEPNSSEFVLNDNQEMFILDKLIDQEISLSDQLEFILMSSLRNNFISLVEGLVLDNSVNKINYSSKEFTLLTEGLLHFSTYELGLIFFERINISNLDPAQLYIYAECLHSSGRKTESIAIFKKIVLPLGRHYRLIDERLNQT